MVDLEGIIGEEEMVDLEDGGKIKVEEDISLEEEGQD